MPHPAVLDNEVWCPRCKRYVQLLKVAKAARVADVSCKSVYRYVEEGKVYSVKVAGSTIRICSGCLLKHDDEDSTGK
jgi:predicted transcriptional regulator